MGEIIPEAQTKRQNVDDKIYYNQNEKLEMFGVAHVYTRDGFLGKTVGDAVDYNVSTFLRVKVLQKIIEMIPLKYRHIFQVFLTILSFMKE